MVVFSVPTYSYQYISLTILRKMVVQRWCSKKHLIMCTTLQEFSDKLDRLDAEFAKKMEEQNKKFFADKPDESTLSPEMKEHYDKFEKMIKEHTDKAHTIEPI